MHIIIAGLMITVERLINGQSKTTIWMERPSSENLESMVKQQATTTR